MLAGNTLILLMLYGYYLRRCRAPASLKRGMVRSIERRGLASPALQSAGFVEAWINRSQSSSCALSLACSNVGFVEAWGTCP
jgi:hypothetical protein